MKYSVGTKVRIKSIDWYLQNKRSDKNVECGETIFTIEMVPFCSSIMTIDYISPINGMDFYRMKEDKGQYCWTDEMIEELVEEETKPKYEDEVNGEYYSTPKYLVRPNGYQFVDENGNVINAMKIVLEKKKMKYPKTYEECCEIMHSDPKFYVDTHLYSGTLGALYKLLICRDAYWKIAGEEMGLGKPWEPDWMNNLQYKHYISTEWDEIKTNFNSTTNKVLAFPTEEMRDVFYENFKKEIEMCKELL